MKREQMFFLILVVEIAILAILFVGRFFMRNINIYSNDWYHVGTRNLYDILLIVTAYCILRGGMEIFDKKNQ